MKFDGVQCFLFVGYGLYVVLGGFVGRGSVTPCWQLYLASCLLSKFPALTLFTHIKLKYRAGCSLSLAAISGEMAIVVFMGKTINSDIQK